MREGEARGEVEGAEVGWRPVCGHLQEAERGHKEQESFGQMG